jgi:hypothetical protein
MSAGTASLIGAGGLVVIAAIWLLGRRRRHSGFVFRLEVRHTTSDDPHDADPPTEVVTDDPDGIG